MWTHKLCPSLTVISAGVIRLGNSPQGVYGIQIVLRIFLYLLAQVNEVSVQRYRNWWIFFMCMDVSLDPLTRLM